MEVILVVAGALLISVGTGMWLVSAGLVVAGAQCLVAAYVLAYLRVRKAAR